MSKLLKSFLLAFLLIFAVTGISLATTYTFGDSYVNWPGYEFVIDDDDIGTPELGDMIVQVNDSGLLEFVAIEVAGRRYGDSLFINSNYTGNDVGGLLSDDWESWDYYVRQIEDSDGIGSDTPQDWRDNNSTPSGLYSVSSNDYTLSPEGRAGHPNGIADDGSLTLFGTGLDFRPSYDGSTLFYDFSGLGIEVGGEFVIGYTPWCANDVILAAPVPEPATMLLFGMGLLGLAGVSRRKINS